MGVFVSAGDASKIRQMRLQTYSMFKYEENLYIHELNFQV